MVRKKPLSRRFFLRGAGNVVIAIPFLDAMIPTFAYAQSTPQYRFVNIYYGSCNGGDKTIVPAKTGLLSSPLGSSIQSLESIKQHMSIISGLNLPQHNSNTLPPPGEATKAQHGKVESPILSGVRTIPNGMAKAHSNGYSLIRGTTCDQIAAKFLGAGSKFPSLQIRAQAADYNGAKKAPQALSVVKNGTILSEYRPIVSPLEMYEKLFSSGLPIGGSAPPVSSLPLRKKSVLDLVLGDANKLINSLVGQDRERVQLHFESIRELEKSLGAPVANGGSQSSAGVCTAPTKPGADPSISSYGFGGWSNETLRGEQQALMIAYALQCGLTNVVSWALTHSQVFLNSQHTGRSNSSNPASGISAPDIHHDSHNSSSAINAANHDWAAHFFGMLVEKLVEMQDSHGSLLKHTFVSMVCAEGTVAHNRSSLTYLAAGCPDRLRMGEHIDGNNAHPAQLQISGLQAIGMGTQSLGEVTSGPIVGLMK